MLVYYFIQINQVSKSYSRSMFTVYVKMLFQQMFISMLKNTQYISLYSNGTRIHRSRHVSAYLLICLSFYKTCVTFLQILKIGVEGQLLGISTIAIKAEFRFQECISSFVFVFVLFFLSKCYINIKPNTFLCISVYSLIFWSLFIPCCVRKIQILTFLRVIGF